MRLTSVWQVSRKATSHTLTPVQTANDEDPRPKNGDIPGRTSMSGTYSGFRFHQKTTAKKFQSYELSSTDLDVEDDGCFLCGKDITPHHTGGHY